jgi:hypothetical protein
LFDFFVMRCMARKHMQPIPSRRCVRAA